MSASSHIRSLTLVGVCLVAAISTPSARADTLPTLNQATLSAILVQGVKTEQVPAGLAPPLPDAQHDVSLAWRDGCLLGHGATTMNKPCVFGDPTSHTTVVLFGDSHAGAWFAGLQVVSLEQHWRLVFMGKIGCPSVSDVLVKRINGEWYHSCVTWRHDMERAIVKLHPNLLVITSSDYVGRAQPDSGKHNSHHQRTWLKGVATVFKTLRHAADHVAFLANVPRLMKPAWQCVAAHRSDVFPCTVARSQAFQWPNVRQAELQLAAEDGIAGIDPAPWFCTPTRCPVIADNILIFRDTQHITPQWSEFLAPMLATALTPLLSPPTA
jgi:hypothetical protein